MASTCTNVRHEYADWRHDEVRLLRDDEVVRAAAAKSSEAFCYRSIGAATGCDGRAGAPRSVGAGVCRVNSSDRFSYRTSSGAFGSASCALLHVSHLIHGR